MTRIRKPHSKEWPRIERRCDDKRAVENQSCRLPHFSGRSTLTTCTQNPEEVRKHLETLSEQMLEILTSVRLEVPNSSKTLERFDVQSSRIASPPQYVFNPFFYTIFSLTSSLPNLREDPSPSTSVHLDGWTHPPTPAWGWEGRAVA